MFGQEYRFIGEAFIVVLNSPSNEEELKEKVKGCCCSTIRTTQDGKFFVIARRLKDHYIDEAYSK